MTATDRLQGFTLGAAIKGPCLVASTTSLTLSSTQTIDGVAVSSGDRVLVKDNDSTDNGIYECRSSAWARTGDCDGQKDLVQGTMVFIVTGDTFGGRIFTVSSTGANVPGSSTGVTFSTAF